jgi:predicted  nucleic acid-binding Zn-ribbon protein
MANETSSTRLKSHIQDMSSSLREMQSSARLTDLRDRVEDLGGTVSSLDQRIQALRNKGYAFEKDLEAQAGDFAKSWAGIAPDLEREISREASSLARSLGPLESQLSELSGAGGAPAMLLPRAEKLKTEVENLEGRIEAVEENIRGAYDQFQSDVSKLEYHLGRLEWMMTELSEASFQLLATESGIMAVKAVWAKEGKQTKEDPEGVLYLTDQRVIFEKKEKVATKKVLFVATEKELVQETLWEVPVVLVEEAKSRKEGFLNKDDYLELSLDSRAAMDKVHLHIWQRGDDWVALINRAKSGDFDQIRAIPIDEAVLERVKNAPTKCPSCGGAVNQPILRGVESLTCEYCGDPIRI